MLVSSTNFDAVIEDVKRSPWAGLDTETTGLHFWKDKLFAIIITTPKDSYYFDFKTLTLDQIATLSDVFEFPEYIWFIANAKFDMHMLANQGFTLAGHVWCLTAQERVIRNDYFPAETQYNLSALAKRYLNESKDDAVEEYILKNKLYDRIQIPGKKKEVKAMHFDQVPLSIIQPYAEKDGRLHLGVGEKQVKVFQELAQVYGPSPIYGSILDVHKNEMRLTKTCFNMERAGIKIDENYTRQAMQHEGGEIEKLKASFKSLTGFDYQDSNKLFTQAFERLGLAYPLTEKGNPSFNAEVLELTQNPVADLISGIRHFEKRIGTYYSSFLYFKDADGFIHPNVKQGGTEHGRMSYSDPNLQNVPKEDDEEDLKKPYLVRSCFVPDSEDFCLVAIDWRAQEFRMILDYAGEHVLIEAINNGADPHQATADETGLNRRQSKVINFGIAYGMGDEKLAKALGVSTPEAKEMKAKYYRKMRGVERLIKQVGATAKNRRYIRNWMGRVCHLNDPEYAYVMFNHLISGGCADVCKVAMNKADDMLMRTRSKLLVQVHDELLYKVHRAELDIVPALSKMMDGVYKPQNGMLLTTSTEHSWRSWGKRDLVKGEPCFQKSSELKTEKLKTSQSPMPIHST